MPDVWLSDEDQRRDDGQGLEVSEKEFIAQIVIDYDPAKGLFSMRSNVHDEVLTTGMLEMAKEKLKQNYQLAQIKELQNKRDNGIIAVQ